MGKTLKEKKKRNKKEVLKKAKKKDDSFLCNSNLSYSGCSSYSRYCWKERWVS